MNCRYLGVYLGSLGFNSFFINLFGAMICKSKPGINSGFSGGPVINEKHEVVGVLSADLSAVLERNNLHISDSNSLLLFSPMINLSAILPDLADKKKVDKPTVVRINNLINLKFTKSKNIEDALIYGGEAFACISQDGNFIGTAVERFSDRSYKFSIADILNSGMQEHGDSGKFGISEALCKLKSN